MEYEVEHDTLVHPSCIDAALQINPHDDAANIMAYLLPEGLKSMYIYRCVKALVDYPEYQNMYAQRIRDLIWKPEFYGLEDIREVTRLRTSPRLRSPTCESCDHEGFTCRVRICKGEVLSLDLRCYRGLRKRALLNNLMDVQQHMDEVGWINTQKRLRDLVELVEDIEA